MADVRLTATNPEDSSVVPVACDAAGRLLLEEPVQGPAGPPGEQGPPGEDGQNGQDGQDGDPFSGNFAGDVTFGGSATFAGTVDVNNGAVVANSSGYLDIYRQGQDGSGSMFRCYGDIGGENKVLTTRLYDGGRLLLGNSLSAADNNLTLSSAHINLNGLDGSATFAGDMVVGSRSKQWMLVEQGGLCHMVEQVTRTTADLPTPAADKYPELRDVFAELNIVEKALAEVMVKLRMQVPAGWPVWDGSDEISTLPRKSS